MNNFKMEVLEHRDPFTHVPVHVINICHPLQRLMVKSPKKRKYGIDIVKMHYAPYKGITFSFHRMED